MLFVCIIMHTPPNASSNTVNNTVIFIGIPAFLIMARPFDISINYDINKPTVLLCEKCIIIFTMTEQIITYAPNFRAVIIELSTASSKKWNISFLPVFICGALSFLLSLSLKSRITIYEHNITGV